MSQIETPKWNKYQFKEQYDESKESEEENIDDSMYAELHSPFEDKERRRYVSSSLTGESPFILGFSSIQFMQIESINSLKNTYSYPPSKPLNSIEIDLETIDKFDWSATEGDSNTFVVHFKAN